MLSTTPLHSRILPSPDLRVRRQGVEPNTSRQIPLETRHVDEHLVRWTVRRRGARKESRTGFVGEAEIPQPAVGAGDEREAGGVGASGDGCGVGSGEAEGAIMFNIDLLAAGDFDSWRKY